ncbi:hypothetical protein C0995_003511 [Termitomyces sp. Mi166|nr:hypothetical protein C0995_003511 [Termitomyces sp. Mi166\
MVPSTLQYLDRAKPEPSSAVQAEAWLPEYWYGRFLGLGNKGLDGCIDYTNLDYGTSLHFATVGSNNGHNGNDGIAFLNELEVLADFSFRAVHLESVIGKQIVEAYYGRPHDKAYFLGCSMGGRQGTQSALMYPEDFDGIVAGAPATNFNFFEGWAAMLGQRIGAPDPTGNDSFIPPELWDVVAAEVLRQCDGQDGVEDGIITEPDECRFRPEAILCVPGQESGCLSIFQINALNEIYRPLFGRNGEFLYSRYDPGAEADGGAQQWFSGSIDPFIADWYRFAVLSDPAYSFENFSLDTIMLGDTLNPGIIGTVNGDFSFVAYGGRKFLTYHGRMDQVIPSGNSKEMYNNIARTLSMPSLDDFYRLFLVPGMNHCMGGPGATAFGQSGIASNVMNSSSYNVLLAMVDWVESGISPDVIIGTGSAGQTRMHCRYPQKSVWDGSTFSCEA